MGSGPDVAAAVQEHDHEPARAREHVDQLDLEIGERRLLCARPRDEACDRHRRAIDHHGFGVELAKGGDRRVVIRGHRFGPQLQHAIEQFRHTNR